MEFLDRSPAHAEVHRPVVVEVAEQEVMVASGVAAERDEVAFVELEVSAAERDAKVERKDVMHRDAGAVTRTRDAVRLPREMKPSYACPLAATSDPEPCGDVGAVVRHRRHRST